MRTITALCLCVLTTSLSAAETQRLYLSGHDKDDAVAWDFQCNSGNHANEHSSIRVPSNWELQGFGTLTYGVEHRGSKNRAAPPLIPVRGQYATHFTPPAQWKGQRTFLVFEGSMTDTQASINGQSVGPVHQGGYTRFKYEVTSLLKLGEPNTLDVTVDNESANRSVNSAERRGDYFNYSGIYRPVYLEVVPAEYIDHVAIDARADGSFQLQATLGAAAADEKVDARIVDATGKEVAMIAPAAVGKDQTTTLTAQVSSPHLWTAETPNLYSVEVRLLKGDTVVHSIHQRFGFRTMEVRPGDGLYVNGNRILLKGADRHTFWPDSGRCTSETISRDDIRLMHAMNMNAVRTSHYPPDQHFLDACDEMGMYVLDELSGWHSAYDDEAGHPLVREMVTRDVNHPSILFWDNGNEGGFNTHLDGDFALYDPQHRHVLHPWALFDDIDTKHYPDFTKLTELAQGNTIFFPTEFLHGLYDGGAGAGLEDYWNVIRQSKVAGGGFIWALLDEAPKRVDLDGRLDTRGNLAPDGIVGPYREKEGSFYTIKALWSPVVITDKSVPADGLFHVENRYSFLNLSGCRFSYQLRQFPSPDETATTFVPAGEGILSSPDVTPGSSGILKMDPALLTNTTADAIAIRIESPTGQELLTPVFPLPHLNNYRDKYLTQTAAGQQPKPISVDANPTAVTVHSDALTLVFDPATGFLHSVTSHGKPYSLTNGPRLVSSSPPLTSFTSKPDDAHELVTLTAVYGDALHVTWNVHANGLVDILADYSVTGPTDFIGVGFDYPETQVKAWKYLGDGPFRVYKNRTAGPTLGLWQNDYNNSITGAIPWKYPEFKGYFANLHWAQYDTAEGPITLLAHTDDLFIQNFTPAFPDKSLVGKTGVPYPTTSIALLNAIPPVGTKFGAAKGMGPASQDPIGAGAYHARFSLYFGELPK